MSAGHPLFDVSGKVAVVTGASSGLGVDLARGFSEAGARLVIAARREDRLATLAKELEAAGGAVEVVTCDVAEESDVDALVAATLARYDRVDVLVNNAGITEINRIEAEPRETWDRVMAVNLTGAFLCIQKFGRVMLEGEGGAIVNIASVLGLVGAGQIPQASYAASKGGLVNMTREVAAQWARNGIRVNAIAPAWFESEMTGDMFGDERSEKWIRSRTPMGREGRGRELVGPALFLASEASSYVTGQTLAVDGGWTIV